MEAWSVVRFSWLRSVLCLLISWNFCTLLFFQTLGRPVLSLQISTLFPDFAEVLYLVRSAPSLNERQASFLVLWFFNSPNFCTSGADLFLLSHDDGTVAPAVYLFKGKGGGRSVIVHRMPVVLQSKKRREKRFRTVGMAVSFEDALASTCPRFVEVSRVRRYRLGIEHGAVYYLKSSNDTFVRVGESTSRSPHNLKYTADVAFIKKYSVLFKLGERFQWEKARDFEDWLASIVNARPKFIQAFYRSVNALPVLVASPHDHHYCWFVHVVQIRDHMTVVHATFRRTQKNTTHQTVPTETG